MEVSQIKVNFSRLNDNIIHKVIDFQFFDHGRLDDQKYEAALQIMQDHLKNMQKSIVDKISKEFTFLRFINEEIFQIKKLDNILSSIKTISIKERESKAHDQEIIQNKIIKLKRKINNFDNDFINNNQEIELKNLKNLQNLENLKNILKPILNSITKSQLDYIYDTLGKNKDPYFIKIIESLVQLLLNKSVLHPQEVEKTIRTFEKLMDKMENINISKINPEIMQKVYSTTSECLSEIESLQEKKSIKSSKDYSYLFPFGNWILTLINETKKLKTTQLPDQKLNLFNNKLDIYRKFIFLIENKKEDINIEENIMEILDLKQNQYEILNKKKETIKLETDKHWNTLMFPEEKSINLLCNSKPISKRDIQKGKSNYKKTENEQLNQYGCFYGICKF